MTDNKPKCETCRWYEKNTGENRGTCHINPPVMDLGRPSNPSAWPVVDPNDWCSRHPSFFGG